MRATFISRQATDLTAVNAARVSMGKQHDVFDDSDKKGSDKNLLAYLQCENAELRKDKERIDWLEDLDNEYGNVELPAEIVRRNIHCLRAAIDEAMEMQANNSTV